MTNTCLEKLQSTISILFILITLYNSYICETKCILNTNTQTESSCTCLLCVVTKILNALYLHIEITSYQFNTNHNVIILPLSTCFTPFSYLVFSQRKYHWQKDGVDDISRPLDWVMCKWSQHGTIIISNMFITSCLILRNVLNKAILSRMQFEHIHFPPSLSKNTISKNPHTLETTIKSKLNHHLTVPKQQQLCNMRITSPYINLYDITVIFSNKLAVRWRSLSSRSSGSWGHW